MVNNFFPYHFNNFKIISLISLLISITFSFLICNPPIILVIIFTLILVLLKNRRIIIGLIIISNLALTGIEFKEFRLMINILSFLMMAFYFFVDFGLNFKAYPEIPNSLFKVILFILFSLFVSTLFSVSKFESLLSFIRQIVFFVFTYFLFSQIKSEKDIKLLVVALFVSAFLIGISMYIEFIEKGATFFVNQDALLRLAGVYENPNYVGLLLAVTIPINISVLMFSFTKTKNQIFYYILLLLFQFGILLLSDSRASMLSVFISVVIIFWFSPKKSKKIFSIILAFTTVIVLISFNVNTLIDLFLRIERTGTRDEFWSTGLVVIKNNFLFGTGAGTFEQMFYSQSSSSIIYLLKTSISGAGNPHPHNLFLFFWAENGILGVLAVISLFLVLLKISSRLVRNSFITRDFNQISVITFISVLFGLFIRAFFEVTGIITYGFITRDLPFWILIIIISFIHREALHLNKHHLNGVINLK